MAAAAFARRVGTGMTESDRKALREHLEPLLLPKGAPAPKCYVLSGRNRPHVWCAGAFGAGAGRRRLLRGWQACVAGGRAGAARACFRALASPDPFPGLRPACSHPRTQQIGTPAPPFSFPAAKCKTLHRQAPYPNPTPPRISDPFKSFVVEVLADLRTIPSKEFGTGYTLRFPRMTRVRCAHCAHVPLPAPCGGASAKGTMWAPRRAPLRGL
jgi:hypothetical protein